MTGTAPAIEHPVFYLIYISKATRLMTEAEIVTLLEQSRENNAVFHITGMLLYMESRFLSKLGGRFIQVLEGRESVVQMLFERIKTDPRNRNITLLNSGYCPERNFPDWQMGFQTIDEQTYRSTPGFMELDDDFLESETEWHPSPGLDYLKSFIRLNKGVSGVR